MRLTICVQNLGLGGLRNGDGDPEDRWPLLAERIREAQPDVVMLCEVLDWHRHGHRQLARAMRDLDLDAAPLAPSRSGYGTALLYRRESVGRWVRHNPDFSDATLHGFAVTSFEVGLPALMSFVPAHFTPFSAEAALIEAGYAASRGYRYGPYVVLAGDCNYPPAAGPSPNVAEMRPYNLGSRTLPPPPDAPAGYVPEPDRRVARTLAHNGLVDVAWHLFERTGDETLLAPTGTDDRIDQAWVSRPLGPALRGYRLLDTPAGASDHHGLVFAIETEAIDTNRPWQYR